MATMVMHLNQSLQRTRHSTQRAERAREQVAMSQRGVFFRPGDYAGFWRRLLVDVVDLVFAFAVYAGFATLLAQLAPGDLRLQERILPVFAVVLWAGYFGLLKWWAIGTIGYRIAGVRLTDLEGSRPSLGATVLRAAFLFLLGPLNYLLDLIWFSGDAQHQAIRDKFSATRVVRRSAEPAGEAPIVHVVYNVLGATFVFPEVLVPASAPMEPRRRGGWPAPEPGGGA